MGLPPSTPQSASVFKSPLLTPTPTLRPSSLRLHPSDHIRDSISDSHNSPSTAPSTPTTAQAHASGLRAQLRHLLPRHVLFHVRINIHQLSSVPLVHGEFCLRWKFKHVHSVPGPSAGLLGMVSGRSKVKGKDKDDSETEGSQNEGSPTTTEPSPEASNPSTDDSQSIPSLIISNNDSVTPAKSPSRFPIKSPETQSPLPPNWLHPAPRHPHASSPSATIPVSPSLAASTPLDAYAPSRGMTEWVKLKDHNVIWEHTVDVVLRMDVERDTMDLLPNEVKFVVMQRVIPGDPDAPHNPRLGAAAINLSEYAWPGPVTRRYLLRESKTNATLKLTIELEHINGTTLYKAPPLPKPEILGGITDLLENDVYRTRPKALDLHSLYYDSQTTSVKSARTAKSPVGTPRFASLSAKKAYEELMTMDGVPFDVARLPYAYGPRSTEALIEAIFNPVATHTLAPSPFTYYVAPEPKKKSPEEEGVSTGSENVSKKYGKVNGEGTTTVNGNAKGNSEVASVYSLSSSEDTQSSVPTTTTESSTRSWRSSSSHNLTRSDGTKSSSTRWWKKLGNRSRPTTPVV